MEVLWLWVVTVEYIVLSPTLDYSQLLSHLSAYLNGVLMNFLVPHVPGTWQDCTFPLSFQQQGFDLWLAFANGRWQKWYVWLPFFCFGEVGTLLPWIPDWMHRVEPSYVGLHQAQARVRNELCSVSHWDLWAYPFLTGILEKSKVI